MAKMTPEERDALRAEWQVFAAMRAHMRSGAEETCSPGLIERMNMPDGFDEDGRKFRVNRMSFEEWLRELDALSLARGGQALSTRSDLPLSTWYEVDDLSPELVLEEVAQPSDPPVILLMLGNAAGDTIRAFGRHYARRQGSLVHPGDGLVVTSARDAQGVRMLVLTQQSGSRRELRDEEYAFADESYSAFVDWLGEDDPEAPLLRVLSENVDPESSPDDNLDRIAAAAEDAGITPVLALCVVFHNGRRIFFLALSTGGELLTIPAGTCFEVLSTSDSAALLIVSRQVEGA